MSSSLFFQLIDHALSEIARREPSYLAQFPLAFPPLAVRTKTYRCLPQFQDLQPDEIENALNAGLQYVGREGGQISVDSGPADPVAEVLIDSMMDAFAADRQKIDLTAYAQNPRTLASILRDDYHERLTSGGIRYFSRRFGDRPFVLISACGIPLALWSSFLGDRRHNLKILVVEGKNTDLLAGGMRACQDLAADGADIMAVLDAEGTGETDILGWCNGARTAIALADRCGDRCRSLILLSPALRGLAGLTPAPSAFEGTMSEIFDMLADKPKLAGYFADNFAKQPAAVDWESMAGDPCRRAGVLFGLAAREHGRTLLAPFLRADSLLNLGRRLALDQAYPTQQSLSRLGMPILLLTGDNDTIVNCAFCRAALATWAPKTIHATVSGAGHYIHDLQYAYFIAVLQNFLTGRQPTRSARVYVESLNARAEPNDP